jgi:hypothetical protein
VHNISESIKAHIHAVKDRFSQTVILLKKAFEQDDILSPECEAVRQEILTAREETRDERGLLEKFFHCVDKHIQGKAKKEKVSRSTQHPSEKKG